MVIILSLLFCKSYFYVLDVIRGSIFYSPLICGIIFYALLGITTRVLHMLGKCSAALRTMNFSSFPDFNCMHLSKCICG